ncbi:hypothetical protein ILUMI_14670 [Ignelater luminosus]|uniref:Uncharacterized protein n=1 Tax=Ignelater luminosus TaxID=2038154 RepID=A0A8K0CQ11_IGNLU|nr:hypothetical protein ILUMI_14670 [Ignelater luminosus]
MEKFLKKSVQPSTSGTSGSSGNESKAKKNRLYDDNYLKFGFTVMNNKPQCVICNEVLSSDKYDLFLDSIRDYEIDWTKCIAICSDGAKAMTGNKSGLVAKLKSRMPNVTWIH